MENESESEGLGREWRARDLEGNGEREQGIGRGVENESEGLEGGGEREREIERGVESEGWVGGGDSW